MNFWYVLAIVFLLSGNFLLGAIFLILGNMEDD